MGKALIEKLLRSCNVDKIYMLLRPKKNVRIEERLEKIKHEMVYFIGSRIKLYFMYIPIAFSPSKI